MECKKEHAESARHAYMIAWRDRMIEKQKSSIAGQSETITLLEALLAFALGSAAGVPRASGESEDAYRVMIPKGELAAQLGAWESRVEDGGEHYTVHFARRADTDPDAESHRQDAQ